MKLNKLTSKEEDVILNKGTEAPFSGKYSDHFEEGTYICKRCHAPLYKSTDKFKSSCGWPSFDDEIPGAIERLRDADGIRTEIQCARCGAHLGHVFEGEHLTEKNVRHCVNSISMEFIPAKDTEFIVLGGGCFWCTEAAFSLVSGVVSVVSGYAGGSTKNPTYKKVSRGDTGHAEVVNVGYYPPMVSPERILDIFFTVHDPTQLNRQGNDIGTQYRSIILYSNEKQKTVVEKYIKNIEDSYSEPITTEIKKLEEFYPAEDYHKNYFKKNPKKSYCVFVISPKIKKIKEKLEES